MLLQVLPVCIHFLRDGSGGRTVFGGANIIAPVFRSSTYMKQVDGIDLFVTIANAAFCQNSMPHSSAFLVSMQRV